jgi:hypothetical protein
MKTYAYLIAFLAILGAGWGLYHMGGAATREQASEAARMASERQAELVAELEQAKHKREVIYREKIKVIEASTDACMAANLPVDVLLLLRGGDKKQPVPNR